MPHIMPIKGLRNTTEISNIAHKEQEPIFITINGFVWLINAKNSDIVINQ